MIVRGTVAAYTKHGEEVLHLNDGEMFGENEFLVFKKNLVSDEIGYFIIFKACPKFKFINKINLYTSFV